MLKLYKKENNAINYWETWDKDKSTAIIHWGTLGDRGNSKEVKSGFFSSLHKVVQKEANAKLEEGYAEIDADDLQVLIIEYAVNDMGTPEDLDKRTKLQNKMDSVLGWTGLGHCDGGSMGSGTMEVFCYVVDFEMAEKVIENALADTVFANYQRIYQEG